MKKVIGNKPPNIERKKILAKEYAALRGSYLGVPTLVWYEKMWWSCGQHVFEPNDTIILEEHLDRLIDSEVKCPFDNRQLAYAEPEFYIKRYEMEESYIPQPDEAQLEVKKKGWKFW